jgi:hypothetical protein
MVVESIQHGQNNRSLLSHFTTFRCPREHDPYFCLGYTGQQKNFPNRLSLVRGKSGPKLIRVRGSLNVFHKADN